MSSEVGLTELPQDVLLELAKELDVGDLTSLLATCHLIRELQLHRSLWLDAIARIKSVQMQPLPLSSADELDALSLQQLQDTVRRANRLIRNLRSDKPRAVLIRTLSLEASAGVFCIPGANLVVSHISRSGIVSVWDIITSLRVAHLHVPDLTVQSQALCMEIKGKALIGAYIVPGGIPFIGHPANLAAICIDYRDRAHISISHVISPDITCVVGTGLFINSKVMGFCTESSVISWSMQADAAVHNTPGDMYRLFAPIVTGINPQSFQGSLYLFQQESLTGNAAVQRLRLLSHHNINTTSTAHSTLDITTLDGPHAPRIFGRSTIPIPLLFAPDYGIFAVTARIWSEPHKKSWIYFWLAQVDTDKLKFGQAWLYEHPEPIDSLAMGASGTYALLVVRAGGGYLGLLHFSATPSPHATFRKLDVGDLLVTSGSRFALDDALGLVLVVDSEGRMTGISYV